MGCFLLHIFSQNILIFVFVYHHIMKKPIWIVVFTALLIQGFSQSTEVPFTLEDRDRIMRTEEQIKSLRIEMNAKFEAVDHRFEAINQRFEAMDSKIGTLFWGVGIIIALVLFLLGYMIWDRRTVLHPVQNKTMEHEEKLRKLEYIAKEQAKKDPSFAELLRIAGLL